MPGTMSSADLVADLKASLHDAAGVFTAAADADLVPLHLRPAPAEPEPETPVDALADLVGGTVKEVSAAVPGLSDEDLARLGDLEQAKGDSARKGVLSAIAEETLKRAEAKAAADAAGGAGAA